MLEKVDFLYKELIVSPAPRNRYRLCKEFKYKDVIVPEDFLTNGADVPRIFWSFFPPNKSDYLPAVVVHDYLCSKGKYNKADYIFLEVLRKLNLPKRDIFFLFVGVRFYSIFIRPALNNRKER